MRCLLIYDISHDGARTKVADACLDYGLERVQYSAFLGELSHVHQRELLLQIKRRIGKHAANIQLFPLDEKSWLARRTIEQTHTIEEKNHV
jgi:CRISPR-associated protein Cas2